MSSGRGGVEEQTRLPDLCLAEGPSKKDGDTLGKTQLLKAYQPSPCGLHVGLPLTCGVKQFPSPAPPLGRALPLAKLAVGGGVPL